MSARSALSSPPVLLLITGSILGTQVPLSRLAAGAGIPSAVFVFWTCLTAGVILGAVALLRGQPLQRHHLRYSLVGGLISLGLPNLLVMLVVVPLGSGMTALTYTLPPLFTLALAALIGYERLTRWRSLGILFGLSGAVTLVFSRFSLSGDSTQMLWMGLALLIPTCLAIGNVYRSRAWPAGAAPLTLAAGMLLSAALWMLPLALYQGLFTGLPHWSVLAQALASTLMYVTFFALQRAAGPVYLSQIGYVGAAMGVLAGIVVFGERPGLAVACGVTLIVCGMLCSNRRPRQPAPTP
ncbi:DMT family transporter [Novispirillum itersonii]|uniref:Drug/metabolite transporter (DMT)-like permease n=1 Tax=Novispirillum itersonii TaxID=189 RepID=A0A7W9ZCL2_NOVIT|nr:DMT family transporter [Novispirillum itersonii]MBB6209003.1 drug/metabolite transporter (DMT)-like permease [Novispirillum itersonii]